MALIRWFYRKYVGFCRFTGSEWSKPGIAGILLITKELASVASCAKIAVVLFSITSILFSYLWDATPKNAT